MVSLIHAARDIGRVREISVVLVRHGFGEIASRLGLRKRNEVAADGSSTELARASAPVRLRRVLEDLGPSFVKLGQIMSTRADLLPSEVVAELGKLQDSAPRVSFEAIRDRVEQSLGLPLGDVYESFEEVPLAAASIAQVHRAKLKTDSGLEEVVVKVQRPGIAQTVASDLDLLHSLAALLERTVAESRIYSPTGLVRQFDRAVTSELDFTTEAENAAHFAANFEADKRVCFPKVYKSASTKHVLTLEFLDGQKIYDAVAGGHSGERLARIAMDLIITQVFDHGFFHADPHPGNVLILGTVDAPLYALIDLGMVGRLSPRMRDLAVDMMVAAVRRDYDGVADALYALATPTRKIDMLAYRAQVAFLAERYLGRPLKDLQMSTLVQDLVSTGSRYGLEIPPDFLLVGKALMTIEGIGKQIAPDLDIMEESRPFFLDILRKRYSPERIGADLLRRVERLSGAAVNLPEQVGEVLDDVRTGRLTFQVSHPTLKASADHLGRRVFTALVSGFLILAAAILVAAGKDWEGLVAVGLAGLSIFWHTLMGAWRKLRSSGDS
jgi:ubiquinone biosynthesis protein